MWGFRPGFLAALASGGGGGSLPLDSLNIAPFFAVSYRKLRTAYGGNCCRIRRYSDNVEQDFGFVGGVVDTAGIAAFITGVDRGLVTKRYNQAAGATVDLAQVTAGPQPEIYHLGSFLASIGSHGGISDNVYSTETGRFMTAASVPLGGTQLQGIVVGQKSSQTPTYAMCVEIRGTTDGSADGFSSALSAVFCAWGSPRVFIDRNGAHAAATFNNDIAGAAPGTSTFVHSAVFDGTNLNAYFNGTLVLTAPSTGSFGTLVDISVGTDEGDTNPWNACLPEIILQAGANSADRIALQTSADTFWRT